MIQPTPAKARITRIHPDGSSLADAAGRPLAADQKADPEKGTPFVAGSIVTDGEAVTHTTPDGATGCISLSGPGVHLAIKTVRAPEPKAEAPAEETPRAPGRVTARGLGVVDSGGPSMGGPTGIRVGDT